MKRMISLLLVLAMLAGYLRVMATAEEMEGTEPAVVMEEAAENFGTTDQEDYAAPSESAEEPAGETILEETAAQATENDSVYVSGTCGDNLTWTLDYNGTLNIQGTGDMTDDPWAYKSGIITDVIIGDGVTSIVGGAFSGHSELKMVVIGSSVTAIGGAAFKDCSQLNGITLPDSVVMIGDYVFRGCEQLSRITLSSSLESIGYYAFMGCQSLTEVTIPGKVSSIGSAPFAECDNLAKINVSSNNEYFCTDKSGVLYSKDMKSLIQAPAAGISGDYVIPEGVTTIGIRAFLNCNGLASVTIPESVMEVKTAAFSGCGNLQSITFKGAPPNGIPEDTFLGVTATVTYPEKYYYAGTNLVLEGWDRYIGKNFGGNLTWVSDSVGKPPVDMGTCGDGLTWDLGEDGVLTILGNGDMYEYTSKETAPWYEYRSQITSVVLGDYVTNIGAYAFYYCENLRNLTIGESITSIGTYAFYYCRNLQDFTFGDSITSIGQNAFGFCRSMQNLTIGDGLTTIPAYAFSNCDSLRKVTMGDSVTSIGASAFSGCSILTDIVFSEIFASIGEYAFSNCYSLSQITLPDGLRSIGAHAFYGCDNLTEIEIPQCVNSLRGSTFTGCNNLKKITVSPENEYYCSDEFGVLFSKDMKTLVRVPCGKSGKYTIPDIVETIGSNALERCKELMSVIIPDSVLDIGSYAFSECERLTEIAIPKSVKTIGNSAFNYCMVLTSVTIPESVTKMGESIFQGCENLESVYFRGDRPDFRDNVFYGVTITVYYPAEKYANNWEYYVGNNYGGNLTWVALGASDFPEDDTVNFTGVYDDEVWFFSEMAGNKNKSVHLYYEESYFEQSSYTYNHDLAKASLKLAMSAFAAGKSRTAGPGGAAKNAYDFLEKIGCSTNAIWDLGYDQEPYPDSIACVIGSKKLEEQEETLLIVAVRGQGYAAEWGGNFDVGYNSTYHKGFEKAAKTVQDRLDDYIKYMGIYGNVKLWITGYSRAAATANIVAGKLVNGETKLNGNVTLKPEDLYAYTFETPAGVRALIVPRAEKYGNIFNIINDADFVTKVAPADWGYTRFGVDCFLPDLSGEYDQILQDKYEQLVGEEYTYIFPFGKSKDTPLRQSLYLDKAVSKIGRILGGQLGYVTSHQRDIVDSCAANKGLPAVEDLFSANLLFKGLVNAESVIELADVIIKHVDEIKFGHFPENCLAMMEIMTDESGYKSGKYKYYIVKCPVDVFVEDDNGNIVASIENDSVSQLGNENVDVYVDENGDKYVFIQDDANYNLQISATDNGEMDCTVISYQQGMGKTSQSVFFDVPLTDGESYTAPFSMSDNNYELVGKEGRILPDVTVSEDQICSTSVTVEVIGDGSAAGMGTCYTVGDTVNLYATAAEGSVFAGWYQDGVCVSREEHYAFTAKGDSDFTALFLSTDVTMEMKQEYIVLKYDPSQAATAQLQVNIVPEEWKEFITWSAETEDAESEVISIDENGLITALNVGTAYAVAKVELKGYSFTARCRVDVAETETVEAVQQIKLEGIQLGTAKVTSELNSTAYTELEVLLKLPQNMTQMSTGSNSQIPEDLGVAIESARFTDETMAKYFSLIPQDDRTLAIVPTDVAISNPKEVKSSYKGTVGVTVEGKEYFSEILSLSVKKSVPKLKATVPAFNSFYAGQSQDLVITGATVTAVEAVSLPDWLTLEGQTLSLAENAPAKKLSGKANLLIYTEEWRIPAEISLSVKNSYKAAALKLSASSVTLNTSVKDSAVVTVTANPTDYDISEATFRLTDSAGKVDKTGELTVAYENGEITVGATEKTKGNYKLFVSIGAAKEAALTVKTVSKEPSVSFKVKGNPDINIPGSAAQITPTFKNYSGDFTLVEEENQQLNLTQTGKTIRVSAKGGTAAGSYTLTLKLELADGTVITDTAKVKVKETTLKLKLSASKLVLNKAIGDVGDIEVTSATKGYTVTAPVWSLMDKSGKNPSDGKLDINWNNGKLTVATNDLTAYGATYKLLIKAGEVHPAQTLTITILAQNKSAVTATLKASGKIDVIRDGSSVTVTPSYKNSNAQSKKTEILAFYKEVGKVLEPADDLFTYEPNGNGGYTVTKAKGAKLDHSGKYRVELVAVFGKTYEVRAKPVSISVKQGSAKVKLTEVKTTLFSRDKYDRAEFVISGTDGDLNAIKTVEIKDSKYENILEIIDYGNGEYAIGFPEGKADSSLIGKTITVNFNIYFEGNETAKANTTAKMKITVLK